MVFLVAFALTDLSKGFGNVFTRGEFVLRLVLMLAVLVLALVISIACAGWVNGIPKRLRERYFPVHACDQRALAGISEVLEKLSRESGRYDFAALRARSGIWHGTERMFVWGTLGAQVPGEGGLEWGSCECAFVLAPRSEEMHLRAQGGRISFIFCGKDHCILRLEGAELRSVTFSKSVSS